MPPTTDSERKSLVSTSSLINLFFHFQLLARPHRAYPSSAFRPSHPPVSQFVSIEASEPSKTIHPAILPPDYYDDGRLQRQPAPGTAPLARMGNDSERVSSRWREPNEQLSVLTCGLPETSTTKVGGDGAPRNESEGLPPPQGEPSKNICTAAIGLLPPAGRRAG